MAAQYPVPVFTRSRSAVVRALAFEGRLLVDRTARSVLQVIRPGVTRIG
jgi:hypothetical protein